MWWLVQTGLDCLIHALRLTVLYHTVAGNSNSLSSSEPIMWIDLYLELRTVYGIDVFLFYILEVAKILLLRTNHLKLALTNQWSPCHSVLYLHFNDCLCMLEVENAFEITTVWTVTTVPHQMHSILYELCFWSFGKSLHHEFQIRPMLLCQIRTTPLSTIIKL